ncbi:MAG: DUF1631 domain-containing protein [Burkholderiales bacterium]|nr:DUF1631 domain-containing protein [Burkholderiales bacterium]
MPAPITPAATPLARVARERFVAHLEEMLPGLSDAIRARLIELTDAATNMREMQDRRDQMLDFDRARHKWVQGVHEAWRRAMVPPTATARVRLDMMNLSLIGDDVVENKILSSRLAMAVHEKAVWDIGELKVRVQHLEGGDGDFGNEDVFRPEATAQVMVEQWTAAGLKREAWGVVKDLIQDQVVKRMAEGYKLANQFLVEQGVLPDIDLSARVKRPASGGRRAAPGAPAAGEAPGEGTMPGADGGATGSGGDGSWGGHGAGGGGAHTGGGAAGGHAGGQGGGGAPGGGGHAGGGGGYAGGGGGHAGGGAAGGYAGGQAAGYAGGAPGGPGAYANGAQGGGSAGGPATGRGGEETAAMTSGTPLARARARATGVLGQLRRLLTDKAGVDVQRSAMGPSPALTEAMSQHATHVQTHVQTQVHTRSHGGSSEIVVFDDSDVELLAQDLRSRTVELKRKASTPSEKAIIEIVALMFQAILSEERIPPGIRVWFARLQMPVLRVAIAEPEFFGSLEHPARQLIDRMGSCVLGFDAATIGGSALETEIKRVVQVIEQYPETGRRVFQLVYDEFQKFLSKFLTEKGPAQKLVGVAQQVEQKETLAIQYTIELRKMLKDMPVREEIREFLFKVWAEVLAVAAIRHGKQHEETVALRKCAGDLVWAASAKPNRQERSRVIQDLPRLLQKLRQGMGLLGLQQEVQEDHIKVIGDTLADAFMSKTEAIPHAHIEEMTKRLANLEDFVSDEPGADLPLDNESIELMLGIDASMIEVIADGGSTPNAAMMAWAQELQLGNWFTLDHNGTATHVQYSWRSDRKQLHLFASRDGRSYLIQLRRLASYLQAGLLVPTEEEALTVRATREALAKLDANPERLLQ